MDALLNVSALPHPSPISPYTSGMICDFNEFLEADEYMYSTIKYTEQWEQQVLGPCVRGDNLGGGGAFGPTTCV